MKCIDAVVTTPIAIVVGSILMVSVAYTGAHEVWYSIRFMHGGRCTPRQAWSVSQSACDRWAWRRHTEGQ
eukprot:CAMPEP_0181245230 /NCGR_PEP_ID=MMETSP1096-20121128/43305_1 /TAXON_ID=156174 ORGANISM="Chrysochromulina ericina, Strain CCMP281" /NCGR_SAMPLE_ID=MMETSP1096 /ASSEMBLY_ACC=CAM_ASM_000453 /LENGTH=69 /DNA_ID=CAMNT_0023341877 /DNA_START=277 /DNA_END=486 /DNA_ORIENTATION=+